jgi:O-antigen/teichoic acid export membrane protein
MAHRAILLNTSWLLAEKTLRLVVSLALNIWVARHLAPSGLGTLATAQSVALVLAPLGSFALDGILIRDLARQPMIARGLIRRAVVICSIWWPPNCRRRPARHPCSFSP